MAPDFRGKETCENIPRPDHKLLPPRNRRCSAKSSPDWETGTGHPTPTIDPIPPRSIAGRDQSTASTSTDPPDAGGSVASRESIGWPDVAGWRPCAPRRATHRRPTIRLPTAASRPIETDLASTSPEAPRVNHQTPRSLVISVAPGAAAST